MTTSVIETPKRKNVGRHALFWFVLMLAVLSAVPTVFVLGPIVEASFLPAIRFGAVGQSQTKPSSHLPAGEAPAPIEVQRVMVDGVMIARLLFKVDSVKFRPCPLILASWRWYFDHQTEPAVLFFDDTDEQFRFGTAILTGEHLSRPLRTDIPEPAYSYRDVVLSGVFFYQCHGLWPLAHELRINVEIPAPVIEQAPDAETETRAMRAIEHFARWF